jgi:N-acetylneuraminic acid mutarotase
MEVETYLNDVYVLNLSLMEWVKPTIEGEGPPPRSGHRANFVKGKMFVFGGVTSQQKNFNDVWVLKTCLAGPFVWKQLEPKGIPPAPRHGHSAAIAGTNIIYYGGRGNGPKTTIFDDLSILDTVNETWLHPKTTGTRPPPRYYHRAVALNGGTEIMIFGGIRPKEFINYPRVYILETTGRHQQELEEDERDQKSLQ